MNIPDFKKLYVAQWNFASGQAWVGTVEEALSLGQSQYRSRHNLAPAWQCTDEHSRYLQRELQWTWIAVAESLEELHSRIDELDQS